MNTNKSLPEWLTIIISDRKEKKDKADGNGHPYTLQDCCSEPHFDHLLKMAERSIYIAEFFDERSKTVDPYVERIAKDFINFAKKGIE